MSSPSPNSVYSSHTGTTSTDVFINVLATVDPSPTDVNYPVQKRWINTATFTEFILIGFTSFRGQISANWIPLSTTGGTDLKTLTGNTGGAVSPDSSRNINVVGDGTTITIVGNPGSNTMTASAIIPGVNNASFKATATVDQANATGDGTEYTVQFPNVLFDVGGGYNSGTGVYVAPFDGTYIFTAAIGYSPGDGGSGTTAQFIRGWFAIDDAVSDIGFALPSSVPEEGCQGYIGYDDSVADYNYQSFSGIFQLTAGDSVQVILTGYGVPGKTVSIAPVETNICSFAGALIA